MDNRILRQAHYPETTEPYRRKLGQTKIDGWNITLSPVADDSDGDVDLSTVHDGGRGDAVEPGLQGCELSCQEGRRWTHGREFLQNLQQVWNSPMSPVLVGSRLLGGNRIRLLNETSICPVSRIQTGICLESVGDHKQCSVCGNGLTFN